MKPLSEQLKGNAAAAANEASWGNARPTAEEAKRDLATCQACRLGDPWRVYGREHARHRAVHLPSRRTPGAMIIQIDVPSSSRSYDIDLDQIAAVDWGSAGDTKRCYAIIHMAAGANFHLSNLETDVFRREWASHLMRSAERRAEFRRATRRVAGMK